MVIYNITISTVGKSNVFLGSHVCKMSIFGDFLPFPFGILELKALIMCDIKVNIEDKYFDLLFVLTIS